MRKLPLIRLPLFVLLCCALGVAAGCHSRSGGAFIAGTSSDRYQRIATEIEYPEVDQCCAIDSDWASVEPLTLADSFEWFKWP